MNPTLKDGLLAVCLTLVALAIYAFLLAMVAGATAAALSFLWNSATSLTGFPRVEFEHVFIGSSILLFLTNLGNVSVTVRR